MIEQPDERNPVEALGEDFLLRRRNGERPLMNEYIEAFPDLADEIRIHFPTMLALEHYKSSGLSSSAATTDFDVGPPQQLDGFRIIHELGRGGMGVVYEAEQESLRRRVAVKVFPRKALGDSDQLRRFHREAQTAANLHHTNIVPVFGVGEQDGLHYFVMQKINGISLEEVIQTCSEHLQPDSGADSRSSGTVRQGDHSASGGCDSAGPAAHATSVPDRSDRWSTACGAAGDLVVDHYRKRTEWKWVTGIGSQVADALAFAHAQGVVHGDIKPGNLLLDPRGVVWVADFGLATLLESEERNDQDKIIGTLRFMAPEQLNGERGPASDIYNLGATLYELVTREPAFEESSRARLLDKIVKGDFRPVRAVRPGVPRDLEAIILKAMSRDPQRRYQTAQALAEDLRQAAEGRPVSARRISPTRRLIRWARRSPALATPSTALLLVIVFSFVLISAKWREAVAGNHRAERNLELALESMDHILQRYTSSWMAHPNVVGLTDEAAESDIGYRMVVSDHSAEVLKDALRFYDRFTRNNPTHPRLQSEIAKVHRRVADIYSRLGQYGKAEEAYRRSLDSLDDQPTRNQMPLALERAQVHNQIGLALHARSRFQDAESEFVKTETILLNPSLAEEPDCQAELARTYTHLGHSQWRTFRTTQARTSHQRAISLLERLAREEPENASLRLALAQAYRTYHPLVSFRRRSDEPERIRAAGIALLETLVKDFPDVPDYQCELSEMLMLSSHRRRRNSESSDGLEPLERSIAIARGLSEAYPSVPQYRAVLARALKEMGYALNRAGEQEAEHYYEESLQLYYALVREYEATPAYRILLAMALRDRAEMLRRSERHLEARPILEEAIAQQRAYIQMRPENPFGNAQLARLYGDLARTLASLGEDEAAETARNKADQIRPESARSSRRS